MFPWEAEIIQLLTSVSTWNSWGRLDFLIVDFEMLLPQPLKYHRKKLSYLLRHNAIQCLNNMA